MTDIDKLIEELEGVKEGSIDLNYKIDKALWPDDGVFWGISEYTTSVDAALGLVPEGWRFGVTNTDKEGASAALYQYTHPALDPIHTHAKTAPLAICIAALKARKEKE